MGNVIRVADNGLHHRWPIETLYKAALSETERHFRKKSERKMATGDAAANVVLRRKQSIVSSLCKHLSLDPVSFCLFPRKIFPNVQSFSFLLQLRFSICCSNRFSSLNFMQFLTPIYRCCWVGISRARLTSSLNFWSAILCCSCKFSFVVSEYCCDVLEWMRVNWLARSRG